ncbi:unnamed protein product [Scytosiphon promiscuus]
MGFDLGTCVQTTLGTGVLVDVRPDSVHCVRLWKPRGAGSAKAYLRPDAVLRSLPAAVGIRAKTPDGDGVVVSFMAGGSAEGGGPVDGEERNEGPRDVFLVQLDRAGDGGEVEMALVDADNITCSVAKVMPLVERVLDKSNALVSADAKSAIGTGARDLLAKIEGTVQGVDAKATLEAAAGVLDSTGKPTAPTASITSTTKEAAALGTAAHEGEALRDGMENGERSSCKRPAGSRAELTRIETARIESLVEAGRQRLEGLIDAALSDGKDISKSGISSGGGGGADGGVGVAGTELMRLWEEGKDQLAELAGKGGQVLELDKHLSTLKTLSEASPELAKIVTELENGAEKARDLQRQVEATKTVGVLMDGKARLETGLGEVLNSYRGDESVALATEGGGRLLKALTKKESPVMTKGMKLLKGAQERVIAKGQEGGGWKETLAGWQSSSLVVDGQERLSGILRAAADAGTGGGTVQDVLGLLKGTAAVSRFTDASLRLLETSILAFMEAVPPPDPRPSVPAGGNKSEAVENASEVVPESGGSSTKGRGSSSIAPEEQEIERGQGGQVEEGLAIRGGEGWRAQDLVDLFENGQLAEQLMRGMAQQASTQALTIMERLSENHLAEGSRGMESLKKLLQGYQRGDTGLDEAMTCAMDFLNSEEGQSLAGGLVSQGERGLESLKSISMDGAVGKMLGQLADPGLERRILAGIEGLDTDELLENAEKAISDADARTQLLDGIKDSTVDFLLEYLPHIEIPPISGTSSRVGYAITNLDLSGFRLRKEDVEVQLVDLSDGLEVAVKEGGTGGTSGTGSSRANNGGGDAPQQGGEDGGVGGIGDGREAAAVPWAPAPPPPRVREGAPRQGGAESLVSPPDQRRKNAYAAVLGGAGSPRLPEEMAASSWNQGVGGGDSAFDGDEAAPAFADGWGMGALPPPVPPPPAREEMAPAEVLRVVARGVRAEFKTLQWACRQETFPYTRGTGTADATVVDGYVSLGFSIKRGIVDREKGVEGPLLVLSTRTVTLDRLDVTVANCRMAWLINLLTRLFSSTISTYVCRSLQEQVDGHASDLLGTINSFAEGSWPFLLSLTSLKLEDFPQASEKELAMARGEGRPEGLPQGGIMASIAGLGGGAAAGSAAAVAGKHHRSLEEAFVLDGGRVTDLKGFVQEDFGVVFDEDGPLGLQVDIEKGSGAGRVVVSGLHPGGQAERLLGGTEKGEGAPAFALVGSELLAIGRTSVQGFEGSKVLGLLRSSPRPVQMTFRCYVPDVAEAIATSALTGDAELPTPPGLMSATFKQKSLGVKFRASPTLGTRVTTVGGFSRDMEGRMREAEASGLLTPGQLLYSVNGKRVLGREFADLVRSLQRVARPVTFGLVPGIDVDVTVEAPPLELELRRVSGRVTVTGFCKVPTELEASGAIQPGDSIVSVNGIPIPGAGCYRKDAALLVAPGMFPMRLRISRGGAVAGGAMENDAGSLGGGYAERSGGGGSGLPSLEGSLSRLKQYQSAVSASPSEVLAATPEDLSLKVEEGKDGRPVVVSMPYVRGKLEKEGVVQPGMVLVAIDGATVPGGHFASVSDCRRSLDSVAYPCTLTFRDMPKYIWLSRMLAMRGPA